MRPVFFNMSEDEKSNILQQHKTLYDGYAVRSATPNEQPLYVQDFANDKGGVQVSNKGDVSPYNNKTFMREQVEETDEMEEGIYDVQDLSGKFDYVEELDEYNPKELKKDKKYKFKSPSFEDEVEYQGETKDTDRLHSFKGKHASHLIGKKGVEDFIKDIDEETAMFVPKGKMQETELPEALTDESLKPEFKEKLTESLNMFKRFKKYN
jgi:hypothetical protein